MRAVHESGWRERAKARREVSARCDAMRARLRLPVRFSVSALCSAVQDATGRAVVLHPMPIGWGPAGLCGLLVSTDDTDHVLFTRDNSLVGQATTIIHECGHILYGSDGDTGPDEAYVAEVARLVAVPADRIRKLRGRSTFSATEERTVETFASIVLRDGRLSEAFIEVPDADPVTRIFG